MPLDPNIALSVRPASGISPLEAYGKVLGIQGMQQQQKMGALQLQQTQQQADDEQAARAVVQKYGGDLQRALPELMQVAPAKALQFQKVLHEQQTAALDQQVKTMDLVAKKATRLGQLASSVKTPEDFQRNIRTAVQEGLVDPQMAQTILGRGFTTETIQQLDNFAQQSMTAAQQAEEQRKQAEARRAEITAQLDQTLKQDKIANLPLERKKLEGEAALKELEAAGKSPIQPAQKAQLDISKETADRMVAGQQETRRHNQVMEGQGASRLAQNETAVSLTPEGRDAAAMMFAKTGQLPPMGMGKAGAKVRTEIINRAAELMPGLDLAGNKADFQANQASLTAARKSLDAVTAFESTAAKNLDLLISQAQKVVDTGSPWINRPLRTIQKSMLGSQDQAAFEAARQVALTEIAKVTNNPNLTGQLSDSARHEVMSFNPENATLPQTLAVAKVLRQDMANRKKGLEDQIGAIQGRIKGAKEKEEPAAPKATHRFNPQTGKIEEIK